VKGKTKLLACLRVLFPLKADDAEYDGGRRRTAEFWDYLHQCLPYSLYQFDSRLCVCQRRSENCREDKSSPAQGMDLPVLYPKEGYWLTIRDYNAVLWGLSLGVFELLSRKYRYINCKIYTISKIFTSYTTINIKIHTIKCYKV